MTETGIGMTFNRHAWVQGVMCSSVSDAATIRAFSLWKFSDAVGFSWPNQEQIEAAVGHTGIGRTSQFIKELVEAGFVAVGYQQGNGKFRSANYQLCWPTVEGVNSPPTLSTNYLSSLRTTDIEKNYGVLAPPMGGTDVKKFLVAPPMEGGAVSVGWLASTNGGIADQSSMEDFIVNGRDIRQQPEW